MVGNAGAVVLLEVGNGNEVKDDNNTGNDGGSGDGGGGGGGGGAAVSAGRWVAAVAKERWQWPATLLDILDSEVHNVSCLQ